MRATGRRPRMFRIPLTGGALAIGILATIVIATLSVAGASRAWAGSTADGRGRGMATAITQGHLTRVGSIVPAESPRTSRTAVPHPAGSDLHHMDMLRQLTALHAGAASATASPDLRASSR